MHILSMARLFTHVGWDNVCVVLIVISIAVL